MLAEAFVRAGYQAGARLIPPSPANPHGFFEDLDVNVANDDLLATLAPREGTLRPPRHLWWLGAFVGPTAADARADRANHRAGLVPSDPFVLKDPRFSHTMPSWPTLHSALHVVLVRSPQEVAASVGEMAAVVDSNPRFDASIQHCAAMWSSTYRSILEWCDASTVFVDVRAVRAGTALAHLRDVTGADISVDHVSTRLHRHRDESADCSVDRSVLDAVRDRLALFDFNRRFAVLGRHRA
jgi:hypothetical protein